MKTLVKIAIPLFLLILTSGCVHHARHYSDGYRYNRTYSHNGGGRYYSSPGYYEQDVYIYPQHQNRRYDSYNRPYTSPNKHAKPNNRYNQYQNTNKHSKNNLTNQYNRYNQQGNKSKKFIPKNNTNQRQYNKFQKPLGNRDQRVAPTYNQMGKPNNIDYPTSNQPKSSFGSKHRKSNNMNNNSTSQRWQSSRPAGSGKGMKR